jgi:hypothetical protein
MRCISIVRSLYLLLLLLLFVVTVFRMSE